MVRKLIILCLLVIAAEIGVNYFLKNTQFNKNSYKFADFNVSVDQQGKEVKTKVTSSGSEIIFDSPIAYARVKTSQDKTTIDGKNTAIDYEVKKEGTTRGLKETIVLKNLSAPSEYTFNLNLNNVNRYEKDSKTGIWHFYDFQNKEIFYIPKGIMEDNNGYYSDKVSIQIERKSDGGSVLKVSADKNWLNNPGRGYPVKIDPSILIPGPKLHLSITNLGRFHWGVGVQYQIKDESGKVLGSDVVTLTVEPDETNNELYSFLQDYLKTRLATWVLAQGNYSLKEMSNDTLDSKNFKSSDSADDLGDHQEERQARKKLMDSFNPSSYPEISMDPAEADALQNPVFDQKDKNGNSTGKLIKNTNPTFKVGNEVIGAGTEILRPAGTGDATGINNSIGNYPLTADHWKSVKDLVADDTYSYVYQFDGATGTDYYKLTSTVLTSETINSIDVVSRAYDDNCGLGGSHKVGVRLGGTNVLGAANDNCAYATNTDSNLSRPGGGSWTVSDLATLQAAASLTSVSAPACCGYDTCNVCNNPCSGFSFVYLTQEYVVVNFSGTSTGSTFNGGVQIRGGTKIVR